MISKPEDPAPAIMEAGRVLKPGGLAGYSVWGHAEHLEDDL